LLIVGLKYNYIINNHVMMSPSWVHKIDYW